MKLNHAGRFTPVLDSRNRRVPGLSQRHGRYYGQLWVERAHGTKAARRFALTTDGKPAEPITEAKQVMQILRHQRREEIVLKYAVEREHIRELPAIKLILNLPEPLRRSLISDDDFNRLTAACMVPSLKNPETQKVIVIPNFE